MLRCILVLGLAAAVLAIPAQECAKSAPEPVHAVFSETNFDFDATPLSAKRAAWTLAPREQVAPLVTVVSRASDALFEGLATNLEGLATNLDAQTLQAFQWVIVNDVGVDLSAFRATGVDCEGCSKASALNAAAAQVSTPYVVFVQQGDLLEDAFLERLVWVLETNQEFDYANTFSADAAKKSLDTTTFYDNALETSVASTALVRTSALKSLPTFPQVFSEEHQGFSTKAFFLALKDANMHGVTVPEFLRWSTAEVEEEDFDAAAAFPALAQRGHVNPLLAPCDDCKAPEITGAFKSTCDKSILVVLPWMSSSDTDSLEMVKGLARKGWQVTVATTLAATEGDALMPELLQVTQDVHVLPHFVRTEDYGHYMLHLVKSRGASAVVVSHSYAGYNFLPFLRAQAPSVALVDMVHAKESFWAPSAFFEDASEAKNGGYARLSALFSQYLDASVFANAEDKDWTAREQEAIAQIDDTSTTFYSPTTAYAAPARGMDLDSAIDAAVAKAQAGVSSAETGKDAEAQIELVAASIQDNDGTMGSFVHRQNGNRYDMMFLENWDTEGRRTGTGSGSGSGSGDTPSPTPAPTMEVGSATIEQVITATYHVNYQVFNSASGGLIRGMSECAYGKALGLATVVASGCTYSSNSGVSASAVSARRSAYSLAVTYTATASAAQAQAAESAANQLTDASFTSQLTSVRSTVTSYNGVTLPTVSNVATATVTITTATPTPAPTSADVSAVAPSANFAALGAAVLVAAAARVW